MASIRNLRGLNVFKNKAMRNLTLREIELRDKTLLEEVGHVNLLTKKERYELSLLKGINPEANSLDDLIQLYRAVDDIRSIIEIDIVRLSNT
jgi:uncharacterized protein YxjI